jgi:predicted nuclease of restriction endonuclease-like (RecB) superfamily
LDLVEARSEREIERGLVNNLRHFLAEMGGACSFVGNQHRIAVGGQEYFIDLGHTLLGEGPRRFPRSAPT